VKSFLQIILMRNLAPKILFFLNDTQLNSLRRDIRAFIQGEIFLQGQYQTSDTLTTTDFIKYFNSKWVGTLLRLRIAHPEIHDFFRYSENLLDFNEQPSSREEAIQISNDQLSELNLTRDIAFLVFQILESSISPEEFYNHNDISRELALRLLALTENNIVTQRFLRFANS